MSTEIELSILTPDREFFSGTVEGVVLTSTEGEMGVLPGHLLMVVALDTAPLRFKQGDTWHFAAISGGFAQIRGSEVVVLTTTAEWPEEIEENRAKEAKLRAEEQLHDERLAEAEYLRSVLALKRAITRLRVAGHK